MGIYKTNTRHLTNLEPEKDKKNLIQRKKSPPLVYAVPDFNIRNIVITLYLRKMVLAAGARCAMSFIYGFYGPFKHIPLISSRSLSRALRNWSSWVNHLTFRKQNLAFSSAPPLTALTDLFFIHSRLRNGKNMCQNTNFLLY